MENLQYSKILRKHWEIVALVTGIAMVLVLIVSLLLPLQYSASTQILIIQKQERNLDAYTATKSAERIGKNLTGIIYTSSFYNQVIESNEIFSDKFSANTTERRKEWKKNVQVEVVPESGILEIAVYDTDKNYAANLARAIANVLVNKGPEYHGGGADVEIKIVDDIFISKYPVRPNILLNSIMALIVGLILGCSLVILKEAKKASKSQMVKQPIVYSQAKAVYSQAKMPQNQNINSVRASTAPRNVLIRTMHDHLQSVLSR